MNKIKLEDYEIINGQPDFNEILNTRGVTVSCINTHAYAEASKSNIFKRALVGSEFLLCDGIGISFFSWFKGGNWIRRYDGPTFHLDLLKHLSKSNKKLSLCYFGSTEEVLSKIRERHIDTSSGHYITTFSPPFKKEFSQNDLINFAEFLNEIQADFVFFGLTAPKQEVLSYQLREQVQNSIFVNIGAEFDFYAGTIKRHPDWISKFGFLWLYRLTKQPRKIYKRVFISGFRLAVHLFRS